MHNRDLRDNDFVCFRRQIWEKIRVQDLLREITVKRSQMMSAILSERNLQCIELDVSIIGQVETQFQQTRKAEDQVIDRLASNKLGQVSIIMLGLFP